MLLRQGLLADQETTRLRHLRGGARCVPGPLLVRVVPGLVIACAAHHSCERTQVSATSRCNSFNKKKTKNNPLKGRGPYFYKF
jgi:hypothetical protein